MLNLVAVGLSLTSSAYLHVGPRQMARQVTASASTAPPGHAARLRMSESFDPEDFFETVCSSIDDMRMLLQACEQEEECILEETATLEVEAAVATTARNAAKRHGELTASLTDVREEVGGIKANLGRLRDQRRSAVAMIWDDRRLARRWRDTQHGADVVARA